MEVDAVFHLFRDELQSLNLTATSLSLLAAIFALSFLLSLREVLLWFLKIAPMHQELALLRTQIAELQAELRLLRESLPQDLSVDVVKNETAATPAPKQKSFKIFH